MGARDQTRVTQRLMPPWHIERNVGIQQFKDDPSLSDAEIAKIAAWVDAGAPRGNAGDMPAPPTFPDDEAWHIGTPDMNRRRSRSLTPCPRPAAISGSITSPTPD